MRLPSRERVRRVLGVGTAVASIFGSLLAAWPAAGCGAPGIVLLCFGSVGVLAFLGLLWRGRSSSLPARICAWVLLGGMLATAMVGVMSVLPWALLAGGLLLLAALVDRPKGWPEGFAAAGSLVVGGTLTFTVLYQATVRWRIDEVEVPIQSSIRGFLSPIDYSDAFRVEAPPQASPGSRGMATILFRSLRPCWLRPPSEALLDSMDLTVGSTLGAWPIYWRGEDELVVGLNRSFIDLRLSILITGSGADRSVIVSTVARFNNWLGRLYFVPVRLGHRIVLADATRAIRGHLDE